MATASPLAAALVGGNEANTLSLDPALFEANADVQLGQGMQQQGLSTAPAYLPQALGRLAQAISGTYVRQQGINDLGKAVAGGVEGLKPLFPEDSAIGKGLRSSSPLARMYAMQAAQKSLIFSGQYENLAPGHRSMMAGGGPGGNENTNFREPGTADAITAVNQNQPALAQALTRPISKAGQIGETGVAAPSIPLNPPHVVAPPVGSTPPIQPRPNVPLAQPPRVVPPQASAAPPPPVGSQATLNQVNQANAPALAQAQRTLTDQLGQAKAQQEQASTAAKNTTEAVTDEKAIGAYDSAKALQGRLDIIDHNIDVLGPKWMGAGAEGKAEAGKTWNSMLDTMGIQGGHVDPNKIATYEDFTKETKRAGMELIKSNFGGSREAASIIQMGASAVPAVQNTYLGAKYVSSTIRAAAQREIDLHEYKTNLLQQGQSLVGADVEFNRQHPPDQYAYKAITDQIPPAAKAMLIKNFGGQRDSKGMEEVKTFDKQFGTGTAEHILNITVHPRPAGQ